MADFTFDDAATGFPAVRQKASGTYTLADVDGKKAIYLDGSATNYLNVTNSDGSSLLTGKEELTISFEAKPDRTATIGDSMQPRIRISRPIIKKYM